ncbi:U-box domain-containing protein [Thalictrum thalictroides]|uniref:RING-type E3 ubiquitin transferase n=1 Tax=Thalictrum thalictroides TaxID=46969 RepID=A0A7J6VNP2_THATH|nr:U-box domain-containing protein [Thalictrum thalictroides]
MEESVVIEGGGVVGKHEMANVSSQDDVDVIQELMDVIKVVGSFGDFRRTQRKECFNLVRRIKLLVPLLEEISDLDEPLPDSANICLCNLKKALACTRKLLKICRDASKIYLAYEGESFMTRFHALYDKLSQAIDAIPYDELTISDEVKEQVELMSVQLKRAKRRTDTQDIELAMDMMVVFSDKDDRNADSAILERLAKKLELHTIQELKEETIAVRKLVKERNGQNAESTQKIINLLNKFKQIAGLEVSDVLNDLAAPKTLQKCPSLSIPHEFLCPITLEIMTDPVIVASGQTYERESIQKWFEANHRTCPKTRETLAHLSIAPNFALKNLILQWCEKNKFELPKKEASNADADSSTTEQKEAISSLVQGLSSCHLDVQRKAVEKIRLLSKENPENRVMIAECGGIPPLVQLLSYPDSKIQEHTVTALLNLSIDETNKRLISKQPGAFPAIIEVLQKGKINAKENSAACLFSLSMLDENKVAIGSLNGIPPLVDLLQNGTIRGKRDAITALFNLSLNQANKGIAVNAGIVIPLLHLLNNRNLGMVDEALSIFLLLASHPEGRQEIGQLSFIETLVEFIKDGTPKNKECAVSVLLELGLNNSSFLLTALQFGVLDPLVEISKSGTNRGQRKANTLLNYMSKCEHI